MERLHIRYRTRMTAALPAGPTVLPSLTAGFLQGHAKDVAESVATLFEWIVEGGVLAGRS
jgi:hypothetical protein